MRRLAMVAALIGAARLVGAVGSGGYTNQVVDTKALSLGNAFTAVADNPSALFFNPAGLATLGTQATVGVAPTFSRTEYHPSAGGGQESTDNSPIFVPNFFATHQLNDGLGLGVGIYSPFGLETHWSNTGSLRYVATDSRLRVVEMSAGVGYQPMPTISIGAGAVYTRVDARLQSQMNLSPSPDGTKTLEGDGGAFGYTAGVLFNPTEKYRLGISYRSAFHVTVKGDTKLEGLSGLSAGLFGGTSYQTRTETRVVLPESFTLGGAVSATEKLIVSADAEWVNYGRIKNTSFQFNETEPNRAGVLNQGNPVPRDWSATWNVGVGAQYKLNDRWEPRAGYFYYSEAIPEATWDPSTPESERHGVTVGFGYLTGPVTLDFAYNHIWFKSRSISNQVGATSLASVNGEYKSNADILSMNLTYRWR
jgi:long-chain fatty acid transport protein